MSEHSHIAPDGTVYTHSHEHKHQHTQTKAVVNRLSRAIGHLESVRKMVEDGRDCTEVLSSWPPCARRSTTPPRSY